MRAEGGGGRQGREGQGWWGGGSGGGARGGGGRCADGAGGGGGRCGDLAGAGRAGLGARGSAGPRRQDAELEATRGGRIEREDDELSADSVAAFVDDGGDGSGAGRAPGAGLSGSESEDGAEGAGVGTVASGAGGVERGVGTGQEGRGGGVLGEPPGGAGERIFRDGSRQPDSVREAGAVGGGVSGGAAGRGRAGGGAGRVGDGGGAYAIRGDAGGRDRAGAGVGRGDGEPDGGAGADHRGDAGVSADRAGPVRPGASGPDGVVPGGDRRGGARVRVVRAAEDGLRGRGGVSAVLGGGRYLLRADRPDPGTVDAAGGRGPRDAVRPLRPRLQMGRRPVLPALLAQLVHGRRSGIGSTACMHSGAAEFVRGRAAARVFSTWRRRFWRCSGFRRRGG